MEATISRQTLLRAVKIIKQWHDMSEENPNPLMFKIYYDKSPEMERIRKVLGTYDEIKDEVIECNSVSAGRV